MSDEGKLFIGGLSFETNEESLAEAFGKYGTIEKVDVIRDKETGRSRGFGFVKYESVEDAKDAMTAMNGKSLDGRAIRVDEAGKGLRPRGGFQSSSRSRGRSGRGSYGGDRSYGDRSYGERSYGNNDRGFGGSGGYRSGGYSGGYRDNRMQGGYERSGSYRDGYDGYTTHELNGPKPGLDRRPEQAAVRGRLTSTDEGIRSHVLQMFPTRILLTERFGGSACRRRGSAWRI